MDLCVYLKFREKTFLGSEEKGIYEKGIDMLEKSANTPLVSILSKIAHHKNHITQSLQTNFSKIRWKRNSNLIS